MISDNVEVNKYLLLFVFHKMKYPSLKFNWYEDKAPISELMFYDCIIPIIEKNAFATNQFKHLKILTMTMTTPIEFKYGAFNYIKIQQLHISFTAVINWHYNLLEPIAGSLNQITIRDLAKPINIFNIIGSVPLPRLYLLTIRNISENMRVLTSNTISNVPSITVLGLKYCNIEIIKEGAFDRLTALAAIILRNNRLKTLPHNLFDNTLIVFASLVFVDNPWECTCDFMELRQRFPTSFNFICNTENEQPNCTLPLVSSQYESRVCWFHYGTNSLRITFSTNFRLKYVSTEQYIFVRNSKRILFFLLLFNSENSKRQCILATAKYAGINVRKGLFDVNTYTLCAVDDPTILQIWPRNCISFHRLSYDANFNEREWKFLVIFGIMSISLLSFLVSILAGVYLGRYRLNLFKGADHINTDRNTKSMQIKTLIVLPFNGKEYLKLKMEKCMNSDTQHMVIQNNAPGATIATVDFPHLKEYNSLYEVVQWK